MVRSPASDARRFRRHRWAVPRPHALASSPQLAGSRTPGGESMTRRSHAPPRRSLSRALFGALVVVGAAASTVNAQAVPVGQQTGIVVGIVTEQATGLPLEASAVL